MPTQSPKANPSNSHIGTHERNIAFADTMSHTRDSMSLPGRMFSRLIHLRGIEKIGDFLANTIFCARAIIYGATTSLISTSGIYALAKYYGYPLSGSEPILFFLLGWGAGIIIEYSHVLIRGKIR